MEYTTSHIRLRACVYNMHSDESALCTVTHFDFRIIYEIYSSIASRPTCHLATSVVCIPLFMIVAGRRINRSKVFFVSEVFFETVPFTPLDGITFIRRVSNPT